MTLRDEIITKANHYFDIVDLALDDRDYPRAQLYLAKLSKYCHIFDDELLDYYIYLSEVLDLVGEAKVTFLEEEDSGC